MFKTEAKSKPKLRLMSKTKLRSESKSKSNLVSKPESKAKAKAEHNVGTGKLKGELVIQDPKVELKEGLGCQRSSSRKTHTSQKAKKDVWRRRSHSQKQ